MDYRMKYPVYPPPTGPMKPLGGLDVEAVRTLERNYPWPDRRRLSSSFGSAATALADLDSSDENGGGWRDSDGADEDWGVVPDWRG